MPRIDHYLDGVLVGFHDEPDPEPTDLDVALAKVDALLDTLTEKGTITKGDADTIKALDVATISVVVPADPVKETDTIKSG